MRIFNNSLELLGIHKNCLELEGITRNHEESLGIIKNHLLAVVLCAAPLVEGRV